MAKNAPPPEVAASLTRTLTRAMTASSAKIRRGGRQKSLGLDNADADRVAKAVAIHIIHVKRCQKDFKVKMTNIYKHIQTSQRR